MFFAKLEWEESKQSQIGKLLTKHLKKGKLPDTSPLKIQNNPTYTKRYKEGKAYNIAVYIPITEDFQWEMKSSFKNALDAMGDIPVLGDIMQWFAKFNDIAGGLGGKVGAGNESMKFQVWANTEPFSMPLKLKLYTKSDPFWDVYVPAIALVSQNILSLVKTKSGYVLYTPGINSKLSKFVSKSREDPPRDRSSNNSGGSQANARDQRDKEIDKIASEPSNKILNRVSIVSKVMGEGFSNTEVSILTLKTAILETAKPMFSKHSTESGYPLWAEMDLNIQSSFSAADDMFVWTKGPVYKDGKTFKNRAPRASESFARSGASSVFR